MEIIAKKKTTVNKYWKKSIKDGLNELREHYLDSWETKPVTIKGSKNELTFITQDKSAIRHIQEVLSNYAVPYSIKIK